MISLALVLLASVQTCAQPPHPRLWIAAQDVSRLRALSVDATEGPLGFAPAEAFAALKKKADDYLQEEAFTYTVSMPGRAGGPAKEWTYTLSDEVPPRHDDYSHYPCWTGLSRQIEIRLIHLAFAALVTQEQAYFDKARKVALNVCRWAGPWTDPSYGNTGACLDTSHLSNAVALFYDWCYERLSVEDRSLIRTALADKAVDGLLKAIPAYGAVGWPNGFAVLASALGTCAVALQGEDPRAGEWLEKGLAYTAEFFDTQGKDGGCMEGPGYGTYGADTLARFLLVLDSAGLQHQLFAHPFFTTLPKYAIGLLCPNDKQQTGFGDCWFSQPFPLCMTLLALRGDTDAAWYLHEIGAVQCRTIEEFLTIAMRPEALAAPAQPTWSPSRAFVDVGYASLRDGFSTKAAFMAFKCGPPEQVVGHNHYDHNTFQINFDGVWIVSDPGYTGYFDPPDNKYGRCTFGHNTLTLDVEDAYLENMRFPLLGHDQMRLNGGKIVAHDSSAAFDYVKGEAGEAYNSAAAGGSTRIHFWREGPGNGFARIEGPRPTGAEWRQYELSGTAPEEAAYCCLALEFSGAGGSIWYDDAELLIDGEKQDFPNPGFEEGLTHWNPRNVPGETGKHEIDNAAAHSGKQSARIDSPGGYYYWLPEGNRPAIKPGQQITARFWAKAGVPQPVMRRADREILFVKPYVFVIRDTVDAPDPHAYSFMLHTLGDVEATGVNSAVLTAPGAARVEAHVFSPAGISMKSGVFPGAEQRGPYLNCATGKAAATVLTSVLIARDADFKLTNPGFETGLVGWTPRTVAGWIENHVIDDQVAHSGTQSGRIDGPGGYYYTPRFKVEPGTRINVSFWAKLDGKEDRHANVYWWEKGKLSSNATGSERGPVIAGNEWKRYQFSATVPAEIERACVALNYFGEGRAWYDDVEVTLDTNRPTMLPGEVTPLQNGEQGLVVKLDGLRHLVIFGEQGKPTALTIADEKLTMDGTMACVTLDSQSRPVASWLLGGRELRLNGQALSPVRVSPLRVD